MAFTEKLKKNNLERRLQQVQRDIAELRDSKWPAKRKKSNAAHASSSPAGSDTFTCTAEPATVSYEKVAKAWGRYDIQVPAFSILEARLREAGRIIERIATSNIEIAAHLTVLLVPPSKTLPFPIPDSLRAQNDMRPDHMIDNVPVRLGKIRPQRNWRVFVAYGAKQGIYMNSPKDVIQNKQYLIAGYDMRGLGAVEYAALTLQQTHALDEQTWTILYRDTISRSQEALMPCARFADGQYTFGQEEPDTIFGSDRFRPAVEVKL